MDPISHYDAGPHQDGIEAEDIPQEEDVELERIGWFGIELSRIEKAFIIGVCLVAALGLVMAIWDFSGL